MRKSLLAIVSVSALLSTAGPAFANHEPHITDPSGDADSPSCGLIDVSPPCLPAASRPASEPVIDLVAVDFSTPRQSLVVDLHVLDIDHPIVGEYGKGPEDRTAYSVSFWHDNETFVDLEIERDASGAVVSAQMEVGCCVGVRPVNATVDVGRNRLRIDAPFSVINEAMFETCPECNPIGRGSELWWPAVTASVVDYGAQTVSYVVNDWANTPTPYTIGH